MQYAIVIERGEANYGAYVPDLPGCVAAAESEEDVRRLIAEAIDLHLEDLRKSGSAIPPPRAQVEYVEVKSAA